LVFKYKVSGGTVSNYLWDYGDGNSCTCLHPKNTYNRNGSFQVCGKIQDANGCKDSLCISVNVYCSNPCDLSEIGIYSADTLSYSCNEYEFNTITSSNTKHLRWDFGDGDTSNSEFVVHKYNVKGKYSVRLVIQDSIACSDTVNFKLDITCDEIICLPFLSNLDTMSLSKNFQKQLTVFYTKTPKSLWWQFGDNTSLFGTKTMQHTYTDSGLYQVCVLAQDSNLCADTICTFLKVQWLDDHTAVRNIENGQISVNFSNILNDNEFVINSPNEMQYSIFNINGELIKNGILEIGKNIIEFANLSNGIYLLKLVNGKSSKVYKIIKI
jgi:PKD repeat protein